MAKQTNPPSTQEHLPIAGIQDGVVIMTDGSVRVVLKVEPINFDLKSEQEQNGIIYAYQSFLNSLDFPIQIIIQSKKLDLERYLMRLSESQKNITTDLMRIQIEDYVGFVRQLISVANIMSKRFFVVVDYSAVTKESGLAQISGLFHRQPTGPVMDQDQFIRYRGEANNRASIIAGGVSRMGIKCELLNTQQLIELYYGIYNPDVATEERLTGDVGDLSTQFISTPGVLKPTEEASPASAEAPVNALPGDADPPTANPSPVPLPQAVPGLDTSPISEALTDEGMPVATPAPPAEPAPETTPQPAPPVESPS